MSGTARALARAAARSRVSGDPDLRRLLDTSAALASTGPGRAAVEATAHPDTGLPLVLLRLGTTAAVMTADQAAELAVALMRQAALTRSATVRPDPAPRADAREPGDEEAAVSEDREPVEVVAPDDEIERRDEPAAPTEADDRDPDASSTEGSDAAAEPVDEVGEG